MLGSSAKAARGEGPDSPAGSRSPHRRRPALSLPGFIRPFPSRVGQDEVSYLSSKGAFWLPSPKGLLVLVEAYAHFVHPFNPFLDIENLLNVCRIHANPSDGVTQNRGSDCISLLTLNTVLGAAISVSALQPCHFQLSPNQVNADGVLEVR